MPCRRVRVSVLYPRNRHLSPRVRLFIDWIVQQFRAPGGAGPITHFLFGGPRFLTSTRRRGEKNVVHMKRKARFAPGLFVFVVRKD
jgi:hypothetical protein